MERNKMPFWYFFMFTSYVGFSAWQMLIFVQSKCILCPAPFQLPKIYRTKGQNFHSFLQIEYAKIIIPLIINYVYLHSLTPKAQVFIFIQITFFEIAKNVALKLV